MSNNKDNPLWTLWHSIRGRCQYKGNMSYPEYGGKGITLCDDWQDFKCFLKDMGPRPTPKHSIDRVDNSKGYSKENCRWATKLEQTLNRRINTECHRGHRWTKETTMWTHNGVNKTRRCKICYQSRMNGERLNATR